MRVTARWTGFLGAPGYSNFYFGTAFLDGGLLGDVAADAADNVSQAVNQLDGILPDGVNIDVESEVAIIDSDSGEVQGFEEVGEVPGASGRGDPAFAGPVGAVVNWRTNDVRFGRRIRGRTFIVPLHIEAYEGDGTLTTVTRSALDNFAGAIRQSAIGAEFGVWSRPRDGSGGVFATAVGHRVPDLAAVLRSRRD